jgi:DNA-binding NarL/FixJ family response regulator
MKDKIVRLLLADDADAMRGAIRQVLSAQPGITLLGEARSFGEIMRMTATLKPDVVVMDIHMPGERDFAPDLIKTQLLSSARHVLAMSVWNDDESKSLAQSYGAATLLDKSTLASELVPTILQFS